MYKIALVEDEKNLASLITKYLTTDGYEVLYFKDGEEASKYLNNDVDLWILDIMLPGVVSGYDLIKLIRSKDEKKPVIFTSARDQDIDKIMGLELGSDDYLAKPYSIKELLLRIKNILRRSYPSNNQNNICNINGYLIDLDKRIVTENDVNINLTSKEFDLLLYFVQNRNKAFSREVILYAVWGDNYFGSDRVVDDLMRRLRQKMPNLIIETIYGYGYRLL